MAQKASISALMDAIAKEWGQPRSSLNRHVRKLEGQMVSTIPDLIALVNDEETWKEVTVDFPAGLKNRLKMKAEELSRDKDEADAFNFVSKEAWIFYQTDYGEVQKLENCAGLKDIPSAVADAANAKKIAARFGVPEQNIKTFTNQTQSEINKHFMMSTKRLTTANKKEGARSFVMCYMMCRCI